MIARDPRTDRREVLASLRRVDGWFTFGLIALVCATLAWSLDDALLVLGRDEITDFLFWAAIGGVTAGAIGPVVGWGRWTTQAVGATFAALLVPLLVGWVLIPDGGSPWLLFDATTRAVVGAWSDLALAGRLSTPEYGHHLLVLGLLVWGTSQFAGHAAFGHRRPMQAIVVVGLLLIGNMSLTTRGQLVYLVVFSIASLFLLVRFHTMEEQTEWVRRRIGDPSAISAMYLRGGTVFIIMAIAGSLLLTSAATSAPLAGAWTDVGARAVEWGQFLERFLPASRAGRSLGPTFGSNARVSNSWTTDDGIALQLQFATDETAAPYLAAVVYDEFDLSGWTGGDDITVGRDPETDLLAGTAEGTEAADARRPLTVTVTPERARREVFSPGLPSSVSQRVAVRFVGESGYVHIVERDASRDPYTITALVPAAEADGGPTVERLRVAGTDYPAEVAALYGAGTVREGAIGPAARALLQQIVAEAGTDNPYDLAIAIRDTLQDPTEFEYRTDVTDLRCDDPSIVECFVIRRAGFCQFYASTMAIFLRELGIPARYVEGFLPGTPEGGGLRTVRNLDSHAWVQVFFPGYGWIDFDPTGGPVAQLAPLPSGRPEASPSARPSGSAGAGAAPTRRFDEIDEPGGAGSGITRDDRAGQVGLLITIALLLAIGVGSVAAVAWRRGPRGPVSADSAYSSIARLATRLGFGPRPEQTVYEYAGALGDELPAARPELETVARAKVEVAYGGLVLGEDRLASLRHAQRRLRISLLRLALRRGRRRR